MACFNAAKHDHVAAYNDRTYRRWRGWKLSPYSIDQLASGGW